MIPARDSLRRSHTPVDSYSTSHPIRPRHRVHLRHSHSVGAVVAPYKVDPVEDAAANWSRLIQQAKELGDVVKVADLGKNGFIPYAKFPDCLFTKDYGNWRLFYGSRIGEEHLGELVGAVYREVLIEPAPLPAQGKVVCSANGHRLNNWVSAAEELSSLGLGIVAVNDLHKHNFRLVLCIYAKQHGEFWIGLRMMGDKDAKPLGVMPWPSNSYYKAVFTFIKEEYSGRHD